MKKNNLLTLFLTFFKIGAFTFGGGYAMVPLIQKEVTEKRDWITDDEMLDIVAIAESTPGPIAINTATFVGYKVAGFWGAFVSTLGVILPPFVIISVISEFLWQFREVEAVGYAFAGIRAGVLALIVKALVSLYKKAPKNVFSYILMAIALLIPTFFDINVIFVIIACAIAGIVFSLIAKKEDKKS